MIRALLVSALLAAAAACAGTDTHEEARERVPEQGRAEPPAAEPRRARRIVLVTIDTLRADHVGAYGYFRDTTPFLDSLARDGVVFEHAIAPSSSTGPSHATMFTGLYPIQHGIRRNGFKLAHGVRTLAQVLGENGYRTTAFVSASVLGTSTRVNRGFREYYDAHPDLKTVHYQTASRTTDRVVEWLHNVAPHEPFLLFVHYFDVHTQRVPPREDLAAVTPRVHEERLQFLDELREKHASRIRHPVRDVDEVLLYDGEVRYVDRELRRLYSEVERASSAPVFWAITSDHGEGLLNHGFAGHATEIYNEQLKVPLIFHFGGDQPIRGRVTDRLVELTDVAPTLLAVAGIDPDDALPDAEGISLMDAIRGDSAAVARDRLAFSQVGGERDRSDDKVSIQSLDYKLLGNFGGSERLFSLADDPYEQRNVSDLVPAEHARLSRELVMRMQSITGSKPGYEPQHREDTEEERRLERNLRALGYLQ